MRFQEPRRCRTCGNRFTITVEAWGDYDGPSGVPTVTSCAVCESRPYKRLRAKLKRLSGVVQVKHGDGAP